MMMIHYTDNHNNSYNDNDTYGYIDNTSNANDDNQDDQIRKHTGTKNNNTNANYNTSHQRQPYFQTKYKSSFPLTLTLLHSLSKMKEN